MHHIIMFVSQKIKFRLFCHFSVILTIVKNKWQATKSQNAILNNFEEYYTYIRTDKVKTTVKLQWLEHLWDHEN